MKFSYFTIVKGSCKRQRLTWFSWEQSGFTSRIRVEAEHREMRIWDNSRDHPSPTLSQWIGFSPLCWPFSTLLRCSLLLQLQLAFRSSRGLPCFSLYHSPSASAPTVHGPVCSVSAQTLWAHVSFLWQAMSSVSDHSADWLPLCHTAVSDPISRSQGDLMLHPRLAHSRVHRQSKHSDGCA